MVEYEDKDLVKILGKDYIYYQNHVSRCFSKNTNHCEKMKSIILLNLGYIFNTSTTFALL